jgi:hypothetical protein
MLCLYIPILLSFVKPRKYLYHTEYVCCIVVYRDFLNNFWFLGTCTELHNIRRMYACMRIYWYIYIHVSLCVSMCVCMCVCL